MRLEDLVTKLVDSLLPYFGGLAGILIIGYAMDTYQRYKTLKLLEQIAQNTTKKRKKQHD
jgi:hypothetical protein